MEAAWEDLRRRVAAFTEEFGRSVVLSSSLGHVGTCYTSSTLRASVDDSLRRSDNDIRHRRDVRLGQDPEAIPMRQLRVKISSLIGGTRKSKYTEEQQPPWWERTGIPFMSPYKSVDGKGLSKRELETLLRSYDKGRNGGEPVGLHPVERHETEEPGELDQQDTQTPQAGGSGVASHVGSGERGKIKKVLSSAFRHREVSFDMRRKRARRNLFGNDHGDADGDGGMMQFLAEEDSLPGVEEAVEFSTLHYDNLRKVGEGTYGEVFVGASNGEEKVIKVVPFDGALQVNGEAQKRWDDIKTEILVAQELTKLRPRLTTSFCELKECKIVYGSYPQAFLDQWDEFNRAKTSENDRPDSFPDDQKYVVFVFNNCGQDLESFQVKSVAQAKSIVMQVAYALSVAERAFEFEHRDLHWGNVLVTDTEEENIHFDLEGQDRVVASHGVRVSIIDFTLSRLTKDGVTVFVNLGEDKELFEGEGDVQFEVYRKMRRALRDDWKQFQPQTNVFWISYLIEKLSAAKGYGKGKVSLRDLSLLKRHATSAFSAYDFVRKF